LLLDEINCKKDHYYDFLYALVMARILGKNEIHYLGRFYPLKANMKVVGTGNEEFFPNREHHQLLETAASTLYLDTPNRETLKMIINNKFVDSFSSAQQPLLNDEVLNQLIELHMLASKLNPTYFYSLRDLEHVCHCYFRFYHAKSLTTYL